MVEEGDDWKNAEIPADVGTTPSGDAATSPPPTQTTSQSSGAPPAESRYSKPLKHLYTALCRY